MKKVTIILASLLILGAIFFYSCKKDNKEIVPLSTPKQLSSAKSCSVDPQNAKNPYDLSGQLHNQMVENFYKTVNLPIKDGKEVIYSIDEYFKTNNSDFSASDYILQPKQLEFSRQFENATDKYSFLIENGYLSATATNYYAQMDNFLDIDIPTDFYSKMISLENDIQNSSLTTREQQILLISASVARYSYYYWFNKTEGKGAKSYSWGSTGKADVKGAIEGGVAGAIIGGTVATPVGAVPAYVAGAVSWGAACSVSNAIGQLTGWW